MRPLRDALSVPLFATFQYAVPARGRLPDFPAPTQPLMTLAGFFGLTEIGECSGGFDPFQTL